MDLGLRDKVAFISGASRGIGRAVARALLDEGCRVAIAARGAEGLSIAERELAAPGRVLSICADMTQEEVVSRAVDEAEAAFGHLDIVVSNLGSGQSLPGHALPLAEWRRMAELNLFSAAALAARTLDGLCARRGSFIAISSIAGIEALGAPAPYAAAKAGLDAAIKSFARDVGAQGARVNAVAPGNIYFEGGTWDRKLAEDRAAVDGMLKRDVPLGRLGTPEEVASVVAFLASEKADFVHGAIWVVDGGQSRGI